MAAVAASTLVVVAAIVTTVVLLRLDHAEAAPAKQSRPGYDAQEYMAARQKLLSADKNRALGAKLSLTNEELVVDKIISDEKKLIMEKSRKDKELYTPALSFFKSKEWMENTTTFKIIRKMPKGAALHLHEPAIASLQWLVKNLTYRENVYMCIDKQGYILLSVFLKPPANPDCPWKLIKEERAAAISTDQFDENLRKNLSFLTTDPLTAFSGTNSAWVRFNKYFEQTGQLLSNVRFLSDYFFQALQEFYDDNVQYIELRGAMTGYTSLDGSVHDATYGVAMYKNASEKFVSQHPDFIGAKVIMSGLRFKPESEIANEVKQAMMLRRQFSDFFLGYDLVAQEDPLNPLIYYLDALLYPTQLSLDDALPYFFHAGETKWQETEVDDNLADALLLNTTRLGHGYALAKHPELADIVKSRGVAVEVNPISNQLLGLVKDLRNHAMVPLLSDDFPLVISSDDPATWEALPLTHDFFVAFMDLSGQDMGLGFLKQLAINSIKYSALTTGEKETAMKLWQTKWDKFITDVLAEFS